MLSRVAPTLPSAESTGHTFALTERAYERRAAALAPAAAAQAASLRAARGARRVAQRAHLIGERRAAAAEADAQAREHLSRHFIRRPKADGVVRLCL